MDCGLSQMPVNDLAVVTAIYPVRQWVMTSGAGLPLPGATRDNTIKDIFEAVKLPFSPPVHLSKTDTSRLALGMIRVFMMSGGLDHIQYR